MLNEIVSKSRFDEVIALLSKEKIIAFDCETLGLRAYHGDILFSLILSSECGNFYFNFENYPDVEDEFVLDEPRFWEALKRFFLDPFKTFCAHNILFDLTFLRKEGIEVAGQLHCTKNTARLLWNTHMTFSLSDCAKRDIGAEKLDTVMNYVKEHKLYEDIDCEFKNTKERRVRFNEVPFEIISEYGLRDGEVCYKLAIHQLEKLKQEDQSRRRGIPSILNVYEMEKRLVRPVFDMQWYGMRVDLDFCRRAIEHENKQQEEAKNEFKSITGEEFLESNLLFTKVFAGVEVDLTEKGNKSFDKFSLAKISDNPIAKVIIKYREAKNQVNFFKGFLHFVDKDGVLHPQYLADGTQTGRFSSKEPNLQQLTKPSEDGSNPFEPWAAFIPRDGFSFYIADFQAQEVRLLIDLCGAAQMAEKIKNGLDIHSEIAKLSGTTRQQAKTTIFSTIYGAGVNKLAESLGCTPVRAKEIKNAIFNITPEIKKFIQKTTSDAEDYKTANSWLGHIYRFPDSRDCYRATNYTIQGSCSAITKMALINIYEFISKFKSRLVLSVHDSAVVEIAHGEEHIIPKLKRLMIAAYPARILPMDVSIDFAPRNMAQTTRIEV